MFVPLRTSGHLVTGAQKTLLYGHHGFGKTTQAAHLQGKYGKTFIMSGESGLRSLMHVDIDYLAFQSWNGETDPAKGLYSLQGLRKLVSSPEFVAEGYRCIVLDSLTEASDMLAAEMEVKYAGSKNGFEKWGEISAELLGTVKWFRDLPYHVLVTALAREEKDENGKVDYWPSVVGGKTQKQLPGIFDNVLCGVRVSEQTKDQNGNPAGARVRRLLVTDEYNGWHGKVRDPRRRLATVERTGDITDLFTRMEMTDLEYEAWLQMRRDQQAKPATSV